MTIFLKKFEKIQGNSIFSRNVSEKLPMCQYLASLPKSAQDLAFAGTRRLHVHDVRAWLEQHPTCGPSVCCEARRHPLVGMYTMRNRVSHGYDKVDFEIVWKTIQGDLPGLHSLIQHAQASVRHQDIEGMDS
jgi:hypothetical protein